LDGNVYLMRETSLVIAPPQRIEVGVTFDARRSFAPEDIISALLADSGA
jgi:hypothetical protein